MKTTAKTIPTFLKKYFWDVEFRKLDLSNSGYFIIKRLLEYGDKKAVSWLSKVFNRKEIIEIICFSRIDPKSANFWSLVLGIKKENILCLKKRYLEIRRRIWPY